MTATTYFGNRARAAVVTAGTTPITTAHLFTVDRGFEFTFEWENHELYGTDSIFRVDEAKSQMKITATLRGCKFDPTVGASAAGIWKNLMMVLGGGTGVFTGVITDTNAVPLFDVYIYETGSDTPATNKFCLKCTNAYLETLSIPMPENDFVVLDLKFHGRSGAVTNDAVPVA
jgi:hypothetical protein